MRLPSSRFRVLPFAELESLVPLRTQGARRLRVLLMAAGCQTVIEEREHTDDDHLDAYSRHHYRQYFSMDRRVRRLHYFRAKPEAIALFALSESAKESYLGYSIVPPLEDSEFGRTVLASSVAEGMARPAAALCTCSAGYTVRFGGEVIQFEGCAWMEQDGVISECATCAIWTATCHMAHRFPGRFRYHTPASIHDLATRDLPIDGRQFPAEGLESRQISTAFRRMGFDPFHDQPDTAGEAHRLATILTASGIPVLAGLALLGSGNRVYAYHEVVIVGVVARSAPLPDESIVAQFLVQDDIGGPFRRAAFSDVRKQGCCVLIDRGQTRARVEHLIAPFPPGAHLNPAIAHESARSIARDPYWTGRRRTGVWTTLERGEEWQCTLARTELPRDLLDVLRSMSPPAWVYVSQIWRSKPRSSEPELAGLVVHDAAAVSAREPLVICGPGTAIVRTPDRRPLLYEASR